MNINRFSLLAALAFVSAAPGQALVQKNVKDGIEAWQRSDYASAIAIWTPLAEKGDADAAFNLGQAHRLGRGVPVNLSKAQGWLEKAARSGHSDAQTTLGLLLFDSGSRESAMRWLKQAAEQGEPRAMLVYGTALFNGDGVRRDPLEAYVYVSRAAAQGLGPAKRTLEEMDSILPIDVRRRGVEIALQRAADKPAPGTAEKLARPGKAAAAKAAPPEKPVRADKAAPPARQAASPAPVPPSGKWRIQLGAFSKKSSAEALFARLSGSAPVAGHKPIFVAAEAITRLQVGGYPTRGAAASACAALAARGQACFPVEGK